MGNIGSLQQYQRETCTWSLSKLPLKIHTTMGTANYKPPKNPLSEAAI